jgi:hypothetical protein
MRRNKILLAIAVILLLGQIHMAMATETSEARQKTFAERIDELEAQQRALQQASSCVESPITEAKQEVSTWDSKHAKLAASARPQGPDPAVLAQHPVAEPHLCAGQGTVTAQAAAEPVVIAATTETLTSPEVSIEVTADYSSLYIWRGLVMTDESVFQPGATVCVGNLTVGIWGNMDLGHSTGDGLDSGNGDRGNFTEIDYYIDWSDAVPGVDGLSYSVGAIRYDFPQWTPNIATAEFYGGLSLDVLLNPSVTAYYDFDAVNSTYVSFGIGHSFEGLIPLEGINTIDLSASLGWGSGSYNDTYWPTGTAARADSMLNDLVISLAVPIEVAGWTATPSVNYVSLMDNDLRKINQYDGKSDYVFAGVSFAKGLY